MAYADQLEAIWNRLDAERQHLERTLHQSVREKRRLKADLGLHNEAAEVLRNLSILLQNRVQTSLSTFCTQALRAILGNNTYEFETEFISRRNQVECELRLVSETNGVLDPCSDIGGGVVDLLSFAIRIACWSMGIPRPEPFFVLDEPFKHISESNIEKAAEFVRKVVDQLGVSVLLITHSDRLAQIADTVYVVRKEDGESIVVRQ